MDSGIGLLAAAAAVRRLRPDADLVLSSDPDGMPWGPRTPEDITARALAVRPGRRRAPARRADRRLQHRLRARPARAARRAGARTAGHRHGPGDQARRGAAAAPSPSGPPPPPPAAPTSAASSAEFGDGAGSPRCPAPGSPTRWSTPTRTPIDDAVAAAAALHPARRAGRRPGLHPLRTGRRTHPRGRLSRPAARRSSCTARPGRSPPRRCAGSAPSRTRTPRHTGGLTVLLSGRAAAPARQRAGTTPRAGCSAACHPDLVIASHDRAPRLGAASVPMPPPESARTLRCHEGPLAVLVEVALDRGLDRPRDQPRPVAARRAGRGLSGAGHRAGRRLRLDLGHRPAADVRDRLRRGRAADALRHARLRPCAR